MDEQKLLERITDRVETTLEGYPWLEAEDVRACLAYARRVVGHERTQPLLPELQ